MSVTLTFFKRKGDKQSDVFRGTSDGPGSTPSQWEMITRDKELKDAGIKFLVTEYNSASDLPEGYERKVQRSPYLDLRWKEDVRNSVAYPGKSPLSLVNVRAWALEVVADFQHRADNPTTSSIEQRIANLEKTTTQPIIVEQPNTSSWMIPTMVTASFVAVGLAAVVGSGLDKKVGRWASDRYRDDGNDQAFYNTKGEQVKTPDVKWEVLDEETESLLLPTRHEEEAEL